MASPSRRPPAAGWPASACCSYGTPAACAAWMAVVSVSIVQDVDHGEEGEGLGLDLKCHPMEDGRAHNHAR